MELYRVLLVDDEENIREGISRKMDWQGLGFSLAGEASNGRDALELAEEILPDVVLTDIKMPFMDGLELCGSLTELLPVSKFVIFSGFDDFEYAKQAIRRNVSEYILKPINADELSAVLRRLKAELDREREERRDTERLRIRYTENLPVLQELFYANLLSGRIERGKEQERAAQLDIDLSGEKWAAALAYIGGSRDAPLSTLSVQKLLEEALTEDRCRLFLYNDWIASIVSLTETFSVYDLIRALDRACALASAYLGLTLTVGVGTPCRELSGLPRSAAEARTALEYRSMVGRGQVIYIGDLEPDRSLLLSFDEADERALTAAIKLGNGREVRSGSTGRKAPGGEALRRTVQSVSYGAGDASVEVDAALRHRRGGGFRRRFFPAPADVRASQLNRAGGLVRGALSAPPHADPPPTDGIGGTDGGDSQGVHSPALRGERPVGGKAVRLSASKLHLLLHAVQAGDGHDLYRLCHDGADGGSCRGHPHHRGKDVPDRTAVRL